MNAVGIEQAVSILPELIQKTIENCEETVIVTDFGAAVLIDQREWENMLETLRLFQDKISLKALLNGHKLRKAGKTPDALTVEEAFNDIQTEYPEKCA